jgi:hypothetical protein
MTTEAGLFFYYREGCHLCEEMAACLFRDWPDIAERMQWRDVDSREDWRETWGLRVPVLAREDTVICEYFVDAERLTRIFHKGGRPV